jgi:predicted Zn-dependent protease
MHWFEKAAKLEPRNPGKLIGLAVSRLAAGEVDRAVADLQAAEALAPGKIQTGILLAMAHLQRREPDQALDLLSTLESTRKPNPLIVNLKGSAYVVQRNFREARRAFERALAIDPNYFPAAMNLAQIELREKRPEAARRRLETVLAKDRGNAAAMLAIADILSDRPGHAEEALRWLEKAREARPGDARVAMRLGVHYLRAAQPRQAVEATRPAAEHNPDNVELLDILAQAQVAAGNVGDAAGVYAKIVALQPQAAAAHYRLAWLQNESGIGRKG